MGTATSRVISLLSYLATTLVCTEVGGRDHVLGQPYSVEDRAESPDSEAGRSVSAPVAALGSLNGYLGYN